MTGIRRLVRRRLPRWGAMAAVLAFGILSVRPDAAHAQSTTVDLAIPGASDRLVIGGGMPFGLYFPLAGTICRLLETSTAPRACAVASVTDSAAAIGEVQSGRLPFAVVQSDWLHHAVQGSSRYAENGPDTNLRSVVGFYAEAFSIFVKATGPIKELDDLDEKRVSVGSATSYRGILADAVLDVAGLDRGDLAEASEEPVIAAIERLCDGRSDAIVAIAVHPAELLASAATRCGIVPLPLSKDEADEFLSMLPGYAATTIPARTYAGQTQDVHTVGLRPVLVTTQQADPDTVIALTSSITRGLALLNASHPAYARIGINDLSAGSRFAPLHPAAARALGVPSQ
jgi:TRAP transporter TAXI family solute receptor